MHANRMITAVEAHAEGEGGRVITGGMPHLPGRTVLEKMQYMQAHHDDIRTMMLQEPRGNPALCCNALVPPCDPSAEAGFIIMEQTEYPPMSGSNTICVTTVLLETGIVPMVEPVTTLRLEAPAGLIDVTAHCKNGKVEQVTFLNVPAFAVHIGVPLVVAGFGTVTVDIAWGGMFYVIADAAQFGIDPVAENGSAIVRASEAMRAAAAQQYPVSHPDEPTLTGPTIAQLTAPPNDPMTHGRGAVTVSSGEFDPDRPGAITGALDRSPCGTGTCAKMAVLHAKGLLAVGEDYKNAGPLGTVFTGRITGTTKVGPYDAIIPTLSGRGWITGLSQYLRDPSDPFQSGFTVGDIWG
ncbi:proline racemase family protein [Yoonia sediminilitoris]|uniref:Proline racemase n=1 Tax=Yoonia sediminilitoris TaxID=1286148 RepID=A0A2T6KCU0_9RHOB|nr:proline racemase family protein [Yoonia sediminilitoris]PUB12766.1 proline racemase [Yoonia sediminilitoris]RCW94245.1 proline racemase [Yoonia sediminilitoris]